MATKIHPINKQSEAALFGDDHLDNSGGGGDNTGMEARIAKVESDVQHIMADIGEMKLDLRELRANQRTDFRLLFGAVITVALGLAALMAKGFGWI